MAEVEVRDVLLRVGGRTLLRCNTLVAAGAGRAYVEYPYTFARADAATCATFVDRDVGTGQILRLAEAGKVRIDYPPALSGLVDQFGYPYCGPLLEGSRQNGFTKSQKFDDAAWTKTRTSITADATTAPDGTVTMDKLVEDATAGVTHVLTRGTPALTDNTISTWSVFARAAERSWIRLGITDKSGTNRNAFFNLGTGVLGTLDAGVSSASIKRVSNGYRCSIRVSANAGVGTPVAYVGLSTGDTVLAYDGDGVSGVYLWGAEFETDKAYESAYIATDAAAVTRAADSLTLQVNFGTMALTVYGEVSAPDDLTMVQPLEQGVFSLGDNYDTATSDAFFLDWTSGSVRLFHGSNAGVVQSTVNPSTLTYPLKYAAQLYGDGAVQLHLKGGNGVALSGTKSAARAFVSSKFKLSKHLVGTREAGGLAGFYTHLDHKIHRGIRTLAECEVVP